MAEDAALLRDYAEENSEEAFAELVRGHLNLVYGAALRRVGGNAPLAEDVSQQVFTALARNAKSLARRPSLTGWLYTTVRFAAAQAVRTERRRQLREQKAQIMQDILGNSDPAVDWDKLRPILDSAMDELNERDREAVLLRFFEGQPFADIGATLRLTEDAARMRVERALDKLRAQLARRGVASTAAALSLALGGQAVGAAPAGLAASLTGSALAGALASGSVATGAGLLAFMSTTKFAAGVAGLVLALAVGTALHESQACRAAEASLAAAYRDIARLTGHLQKLGHRTQAGESAIVGLKRSGEDAGAPLVPAASRDPAMAGRAFLARHPEVKQALVERSRVRVASKYGRYYATWGLTPSQIEQFEDLMSEGEGWNTSGPGGPMLLQPGAGLAAAEVKSRVRDLLGDSVYQQFEDATNREIGIRQTVLQLASALYGTDSPLTAPQANELIDRGLKMRSLLSQLSAYMRSNPLAGPTVSDIIFAQTTDILSETQRAALDGIIQQMQFQRSMGEAVRLNTPPTPSTGGRPAK